MVFFISVQPLMKTILTIGALVGFLLATVGILHIGDVLRDPLNKYRVPPKSESMLAEVRETWLANQAVPIGKGKVMQIVGHGAVSMASVMTDDGTLYVGKNLTPSLRRGDTARVFPCYTLLCIPSGKNAEPLFQVELAIVKY